ncbi:MAG TPA: hypothetical protein VMF09_07360 [Solirubrobacteraceae bacterium]|nr:hypothetical protein [Solirubrobacteraceae bacterium]
MLIDKLALRAAASDYATAARECDAAQDAANRAYRRLEASPDTLEYQIAYSDARKREAAAALRKRQAAEAYLAAGGYALQDP